MRLLLRKSLIFTAVATALALTICGGLLFRRLGENMSIAGQCFAGAVSYCIGERLWSGKVDLPAPTSYWRSKVQLDGEGLPVSISPDGQRFQNPSSIAFAMLGRSSLRFDEACAIYEARSVARAALAYFERTAFLLDNSVPVWRYDYDTQVNDVLLKGPFGSAFAQAGIIERLLVHFCKTGESRYADLARRAGVAFAVPVTRGGLRSEADNFVWFQEVPLPDRHNPFIVNAHLYSIQTLLLLHRFFPEDGFRELADRGVNALRAALPAIDNGYWNRYDLRPRYPNLTFKVEASEGVLRSARLRIGETTSLVDMTGGRQSPRANGFSYASDAQKSGLGADLSLRPIEMWFSTTVGRDFSPLLLSAGIELELAFDGAPRDLRVAAVSTRPGPIEFAQLELRERVSADSATILRFDVGWGDLGWGQLAPEYMPFHAATLATIAAAIGDKELFLRAVRWHAFSERGVPKRQPGSMTRRWRWTSDAELAAAVWDRFGALRPEDMDRAELLNLVYALPFDPERRNAAMEAIALVPG